MVIVKRNKITNKKDNPFNYTTTVATLSKSSFSNNSTISTNSGKETGLYYYGARYLDPRTSRWLSVDPAMTDGSYIPGAPIDDEVRERNKNLRRRRVRFQR